MSAVREPTVDAEVLELGTTIDLVENMAGTKNDAELVTGRNCAISLRISCRKKISTTCGCL